MNANPQDNIDFSWSFNNSANLMDIPVNWLFATFLISMYTLFLERRCQICWPIKQNKLYSKNWAWLWNIAVLGGKHYWKRNTMHVQHSSNRSSWSTIKVHGKQCHIFIIQGMQRFLLYLQLIHLVQVSCDESSDNPNQSYSNYSLEVKLATGKSIYILKNGTSHFHISGLLSGTT